MSRTVISVKVSDSVWPQVESWADQNKFKETDSSGGSRLFKRPIQLSPVANLRVTQSKDEVGIESWLQTDFFQRLEMLFLVPAETGIESGKKYYFPKKKFREMLNPLLEQLGSPTF